MMGVKQHRTPHQLIVDHMLVTDPKKIADTINSYFTKKVENIKKSTSGDLDKAIMHLEEWLKNVDFEGGFDLSPVSCEQVRKKIKKMKGGGAHGGDHLSGQAIKIGAFFLEGPITMAINKSIEEGYFPVAWRQQITHPNLKKGNGSDLEHWRPVRHIHQIGIIAESLVGEQIVDHYVKNNIFHSAHHGGVKGLSTFTACAGISDRNFRNDSRWAWGAWGEGD